MVIDFFDVLQLYEAGCENAVALIGETISDERLAIPRSLKKPAGRQLAAISDLANIPDYIVEKNPEVGTS